VNGVANPFIAQWAYPFMVNAYRAGTIAAILGGTVGWFMVLRKQTFAGHTLAVVGFPGAAAATLAGISVGFGYFGFSLAAALIIASLRRTGHGGFAGESAATGTVQAFLLATGFLFIALYRGYLNGINALLFGSFLGITTEQVALLAVLALLVLAALAVIGRRLWFASIDPDTAAAHGVAPTAIGVVFLLLLAVAAAAAGQITGTLLVFALLVMPAATARQITARPITGIALSVGIALTATWAGLFTAYYTPYPLGFLITSIAFTGYVTVTAGGWAVRRRQVIA
jgi:zinc/manganese transport system permease protein